MKLLQAKKITAAQKSFGKAVTNFERSRSMAADRDSKLSQFAQCPLLVDARSKMQLHHEFPHS